MSDTGTRGSTAGEEADGGGADVGAGVGTDVGAGVGADVGAGVGTDVGAGGGTDGAPAAGANVGASGGAIDGPAVGPDVGADRENTAVDLARIWWLVTVLACMIAVVILSVDGYYGYAGVTLAVAASAAINLT